MNNKTVCMNAYAKINLTLEIFPPRPDGYHNVASIMHKISLCDKVSVTERNDKEIHVFCSRHVCEEKDNLAYKAAIAFMNATGKSFGCDIEIEKNIPDKAGLAGGSADCAAVLDCLSILFPFNNKAERKTKLHEIACSLGSDIPFCLDGVICAKAFGRGEKLVALAPIKNDLLCLIAVPGEGLSTKAIYGGYDKLGSFPEFPYLDAISPTQMLETKLESGIPISQGDVFNSFTPFCCSELPEIQTLLKSLETTGATAYGMSGSGSAVFALYSDFSKAQSALAQLSDFRFLRLLHIYNTLK